MAGLAREHCGRDSINVKAYALEDMIVVVINKGTGRNVLALLSQLHVDPDITVETMRLLAVIEPPPGALQG